MLRKNKRLLIATFYFYSTASIRMTFIPRFKTLGFFGHEINKNNLNCFFLVIISLIDNMFLDEESFTKFCARLKYDLKTKVEEAFKKDQEDFKEELYNKYIIFSFEEITKKIVEKLKSIDLINSPERADKSLHYFLKEIIHETIFQSNFTRLTESLSKDQ